MGLGGVHNLEMSITEKLHIVYSVPTMCTHRVFLKYCRSFSNTDTLWTKIAVLISVLISGGELYVFI